MNTGSRFMCRGNGRYDQIGAMHVVATGKYTDLISEVLDSDLRAAIKEDA